MRGRRAHAGVGLRGVLVAVGLALAAGGSAEPAGAEESTWFVQRITTGDVPLRVEYFWSKGRTLRAETVVAGRPVLTIVKGELYYVIDVLAGTGVAIRRSAAARAEDAKGGRPFGNEGERMLEQGAEKLGEESMVGRPCDLYRITDGRGRREACLSQDELRLPLHAQEFDRASGRSVEVRYLDWARGFPAADVFFEADPRIQLERIEYADYLSRSAKEPVGPAPVLYRELLHGRDQ